jgi:hypothetical protein
MVHWQTKILSYQEAISRPDKALWFKAMVDEIKATITNETWELRRLPPGKQQYSSSGCSDSNLILEAPSTSTKPEWSPKDILRLVDWISMKLLPQSSGVQDLGFIPLETDSCIYIRGDIIRAVYVDDIQVAVPTKDKCDAIYQELSQHIKVEYKGGVRSFLGINIMKDWEVGNNFSSSSTKQLTLIALLQN